MPFGRLWSVCETGSEARARPARHAQHSGAPRARTHTPRAPLPPAGTAGFCPAGRSGRCGAGVPPAAAGLLGVSSNGTAIEFNACADSDSENLEGRSPGTPSGDGWRHRPTGPGRQRSESGARRCYDARPLSARALTGAARMPVPVTEPAPAPSHPRDSESPAARGPQAATGKLPRSAAQASSLPGCAPGRRGSGSGRGSKFKLPRTST